MLIVLIIVSLFWPNISEALECAVPNISKTRIFESIMQYQGNTISFSPLKSNWQGSDVEFSEKNTFKILQKNEFLTFDSEHIITLKLTDKQITQIDEGTFISLICLNNLLLDHNNISVLERTTFDGLSHLKKLDLSHNELQFLNDLTFVKVPRLVMLNLSYNQIKHVSNLAFANLTSLQVLNLKHNRIVKLWWDLFRPVVKLNILILSWNPLNDIEPEKWGGLNKLETLELAGCDLYRFDPSYNFSFSSLKILNVSNNFLTMLNVVSLRRHLPQLGLIDLNDNPWFCDYLQTVINELENAGIKFVSKNFSTISVKGVACNEVSTQLTSSTTVGSVGTTTTTVKQDVMNKKEVERYVNRIVEDLKDSLVSLRTFVIFIFSLLCVFIILELLLKTGVCWRLCRRRNSDHLDDSNLENFRLINQ